MKRFISLAAAGLGLAFYLLGISAPAVLAASSPGGAGSGQALEIAPPLITLNANPGQTIKTQIQLRDISSSNLVVTNQINDFVAAGENGTPKILTGNDSTDPFSMKNWITPLPSFTLAPQKIQTLTVYINVPRNASPGGHYGVIRFTGTPPQLKGTGVSLSASLGALVLMTVSGKLTHNLSIQQFATTKVPPKNNPNKTENPTSLFESTPLNFIVRLKNNGNVQEEPIGHIVVTDMFGKNVAGININIPPHNVLPDSIREFTGALNKTNLGSKHLFGLYHAKLTVSYGGGTQKVLTDEISFWIIPYKLIAIIIAVLIVAFFIFRHLLRRYKQHIIQNAQGAQKNKPSNKNHRKR